VHFEISHELDAPLDAVELAVLSPDLGAMLSRELGPAAGGAGKPRASFSPAIESVETLEHVFKDGELRRVLRFQANAPLAMFRGHAIARDAMAWDERSIYRLADHASTWEVLPKVEWRRFVRSEGTYRLEAFEPGRTRRTVTGDLEIHLAVFGPLVARMALSEVRKTYDAEAETLRRLATL
jgi:hypothetical protein